VTREGFEVSGKLFFNIRWLHILVVNVYN